MSLVPVAQAGPQGGAPRPRPGTAAVSGRAAPFQGEAGGFREKAAAALAAGVELVVIRRPRDRGEGLEDILAWFQADKEEAEWK